MAHQIDVPGGASGPVAEPAAAEQPHQFGLTAAMALIVAVLAIVFSVLFIVYSRNTGHSFWVYWAPYFLAAGALLLGIPVYLAQRGHMSQPAPVPPYRPPATSGKHS